MTTTPKTIYCGYAPCRCGNCDEQLELDRAMLTTYAVRPGGSGSEWLICTSLEDALIEVRAQLEMGEDDDVVEIRPWKKMTGVEYAALPEHTGF